MPKNYHNFGFYWSKSLKYLFLPTGGRSRVAGSWTIPSGGYCIRSSAEDWIMLSQTTVSSLSDNN